MYFIGSSEAKITFDDSVFQLEDSMLSLPNVQRRMNRVSLASNESSEPDAEGMLE